MVTCDLALQLRVHAVMVTCDLALQLRVHALMTQFRMLCVQTVMTECLLLNIYRRKTCMSMCLIRHLKRDPTYASTGMYIYRAPLHGSLIPRPTPFFSVLQFALTIIHGCGEKTFFAALPHPCIIVNANRRTEKNGVGLGTRLPPWHITHLVTHV